ncbi:MAG: serine hydrolase [Myxococcota bacterium]
MRRILPLSSILWLGCTSATPPPTESEALPRADVTEGFERAWQEVRVQVDELPIDSVVVVCDDEVVAEHHRDGFDASTPHDLRSSTKSITGLLVGMALDRGIIPSLDTDILTFFPERAPPESWANPITVEDLLTMQSGLDCNDWNIRSAGNEEYMYLTDDWLSFFFRIPAIEEPGQRYSYCTAGVVVLGEIIARAAGRPLPDLAQEWLFEPLGVREAEFESTPLGVTDAGGHLQASVETLAKIGLLTLHGGTYQGTQILSEEYATDMLSVQASLSRGPGPRFGYLWWLEPVEDDLVRSFQTRGNGGQYSIVVPSLRAVVAFTGHAYNDSARQQAIFSLAADAIFPLLTDGCPVRSSTP